MGRVAFWKYEGLGNDFLLVDERRGRAALGPEAAVRICDRRLGVGADGVLLLGPATGPQVHGRMRLLNADGTEAEMCGNGIRCVAKHLGDEDRSLDAAVIATAAGVKRCALGRGPTGEVERVLVDMGPPDFDRSAVGMIGSGPLLDEPLEGIDPAFRFSAVSMGNPHLVTFGPVPEDAASALGTRLQRHPGFPHRVNVGFASIVDGRRIRLRVFERGCGFTLACGTGACAAAAVACRTGRLPADQPIPVELPGGVLAVTVPSDGRGVRMEGPARRVFQGEVEWP